MAIVGRFGTWILPFLLAGCVGPMPGPWAQRSVQDIEVVATDSAGTPGIGLQCVFTNDKGTWRVDVPGKVTVKRSSKPLHIDCVDPQGLAANQNDVTAVDESKARAKHQAKVGGTVGVVATPLFLGAFAFSPAAIVYLAAGGATFGGLAAANQAVSDKMHDEGAGYPSRIELRY
jgi:hypothetical protein